MIISRSPANSISIATTTYAMSDTVRLENVKCGQKVWVVVHSPSTGTSAMFTIPRVNSVVRFSFFQCQSRHVNGCYRLLQVARSTFPNDMAGHVSPKVTGPEMCVLTVCPLLPHDAWHVLDLHTFALPRAARPFSWAKHQRQRQGLESHLLLLDGIPIMFLGDIPPTTSSSRPQMWLIIFLSFRRLMGIVMCNRSIPWFSSL